MTSEKSGRRWHTENVWALSDIFDSNPVKQLVIPASNFSEILEDSEGLYLSNNFGTWLASPVDKPLAAEKLWARLPVGSRSGEAVISASWNVPQPLHRRPPHEVLDSYGTTFNFVEGTPGRPGLRIPQLGALHATLGYWTTKRKTPATVVMPTGTGKTETMLALLVAARPNCLLVLVPSDALRDQVATKFETLGILQDLQIVSSNAIRPNVGRLLHGFRSSASAASFAKASNVIVATPQSLAASDPEALSTLLDNVTHLFIDEAHHVAAKTWASIRAELSDRHVVQFTATPFREDGRHLQGKMIYSFPLREAQAQDYFSRIDYTAVIDFTDVDKAVADQSVTRLRSDLAAGFDHVLMARVNGLPRANEVFAHYTNLADDLNPVILNSGMSLVRQREAKAALVARSTRIVICVNMLGEGFDLPALKVAAVHDPQKSLGVTLQFIGRFARTSGTGSYGDASIFVARTEIDIDRRLRSLYAEDSDWNLILRNLTETVVEEQQAISDFEDGFTSLPEEITIRSLLPKMSTVVYRSKYHTWDPETIPEHFGEERLYTNPIGLNGAAGVAWFVLENRGDVRWGDIKSLEEKDYELYILYFDAENRLLYINNSANDGVFQELADTVLGPGSERFTGSTVYRVMADIDRLVPTNVGVIDAHDQFRRFSMHVGSDVTASFSQAEAGTKSQTNISGGGYRDGERVSISASLKGRIWSHSTATSVKQWCDWCDAVGKKLLDDTISIEKVIGQFILPETLKVLPSGTVLAAEWPWSAHTVQADNLRLSHLDSTYEAVYADIIPDTSRKEGPFRFEIKTGAWSVPYEATLEKGRLQYRCLAAAEIRLIRARSEQLLSSWLDDNGLVFILDDDRLIEGNLLYKPTWNRGPYDRECMTATDWTGIDFTKESQTADRLVDSIQYRSIELLCSLEDWDVVIDDDGTGEIADIVALRVDDQGLLVKLVHCKFSHGKTVGVRVADLYEVCGQTQKSIMWRRSDLRPFFHTLDDRARKKQRREGVSPFIVGDVRKLYEIRDRSIAMRRRMEMAIAQPGLSQARASVQQLDLLSSTQAYLRTTINAPLEVWCSA